MSYASLIAGVCLSLVGAVLGCAAEPEPVTFDPDAVIAEAVEFEANYTRLDIDGVATVHDTDGLIVSRIWANEIGAEVFRSIDLTDPNQVIEMPRGAVFLKENYDGQGNALDQIQVLAKFEAGYYPRYDDWFFALIQRDGTPISGRVGNGAETLFCADCHSSMAPNSDLVIGLPADNLAAR